jgi:hypothetical protein
VSEATRAPYRDQLRQSNNFNRKKCRLIDPSYAPKEDGTVRAKIIQRVNDHKDNMMNDPQPLQK